MLLLSSASLQDVLAFSSLPTTTAGTSTMIIVSSLGAVPQQQSASSPQQNEDHYTMEISYEGKTCTTDIRQGESILSALERTGAADQLSLPALPADCRRGNCLTCVGRHAPGSDAEQLQRGEDGLSPYMSDQAKKRGYIMTCSSFVEGNGVKLEVGKNEKAWEELYKSRLEEEPTKLAGRAAMAKVIRMGAERNVEEWTEETEEVYRKSE